MDIINLFSFAQIMSWVITVVILAGIYFAFRDREEYVKITVLYIFAAINFIQHFFKFIIWPNYFGASFSHVNTLYNVCAFQIILAPFLVRKKCGVLKEFNVYVGGIGCTLSFLYPSWFMGQTILQWEYLRFWVCHFLLLSTSVLPFLWGMVHFRLENYWKIGIVFFGMLCCLLLNDIICVYTGLTGDPKRLYESLNALNPLSIMGPQPGAEKLVLFVRWCSPPIFMGAKSGVYTPILWYITPIYFLMTPAAYGAAVGLNALKRRFYICSLSEATDWKKTKRQQYYERRNYVCNLF